MTELEGTPGELAGLTVAVVGGDGREVELLRLLRRAGAAVRAYGLPAEGEGVLGGPQATSVEEATVGADVLLGPIPLMGLDDSVYAPAAPRKVTITREALRGLEPDGLVIIGKASPGLRRLADEVGIRVREYEHDEELMILRAAAVAEGAIRMAIEHTAITLHGARVLLVGFGRIGTTLGRTLYDLRARVRVAARNPVQLARALDLGLEPVPLERMEDVLPETDVVYNTVPSRLLDALRLKRLPPHALVIDLAGPPGGVDLEAAKSLGLKTVWARGLGSRAPVSVGRSQWKGVRRIILEDLVARRQQGTAAAPRAVGISHILLQCSDLAAAEAFYVGTLGMEIKERSSLGDGRPLIVLKQGLGLTVGRIPKDAARDFDHLAFKASDVDALAWRLREAGIHIVDGPKATGYGRSVYFLDPDGRKIECHTA
jgi:dipicolinate synthase subunit A